MQYMGGKSRIAKKIREHLVSHGATRYVSRSSAVARC